MSLRATHLLFPLVAAACFSLTTATHAAGDDPDVARLTAAGHSLKWNWTPPGHADRYGHAEALINAPIATVRTAVTDYGHYKDLVPDKFHNARVIAKEAGNTDVYMQVPVLHGMLTLWNVVRFGPPKCVTPGTEVIEGKLVKGNVKDMNVVWTLRSIDENFTVLKFDILLLPNMPAPQAAIDEELRDAALQAVDAIHDRAQGNKSWVSWNGGGTSAANGAAGGSK